jgi:hypothetical protein
MDGWWDGDPTLEDPDEDGTAPDDKLVGLVGLMRMCPEDEETEEPDKEEGTGSAEATPAA